MTEVQSLNWSFINFFFTRALAEFGHNSKDGDLETWNSMSINRALLKTIVRLSPMATTGSTSHNGISVSLMSLPPQQLVVIIG